MRTTVWNSICRLKNNPLHPNRNSSSSFHSTPPRSFAKWRGKFAYNAKENARSSQPPKNYARYVVRRKRADAKRALNDFLLKGSYTKHSVQDEWQAWFARTTKNQRTGVEECLNDFYNRVPSDGFRRCKPHRTSKKVGPKGKKCKKWAFVSDDEGMPIFEDTFGDRFYTWSSKSWANADPQGHTTSFKWRDNSRWCKDAHYSSETSDSEKTNDRNGGWESESDFDSEDDDAMTKDSPSMLFSQRVILGLPQTGPLELDAIKTAFRASALKWHPDKHQGPSQAFAGEKFKLCVEAYHTLCSSLNS